jgi:hypothetical protein
MRVGKVSKNEIYFSRRLPVNESMSGEKRLYIYLD